MSTATTDKLTELGLYIGETYYFDPNEPTTCWLRSDGGGSAIPVSEAEDGGLIQSLIDLIVGPQFYDDGHHPACCGSCDECLRVCSAYHGPERRDGTGRRASDA